MHPHLTPLEKQLPLRSVNRSHHATDSGAKKRPNIVLISADNLGFGDWGCFGSTVHNTPRTDQMAAEGMKLTHFYGATVCTPSRASLMTGCYPRRVGMHTGGTGMCVLLPLDPKGLNPSETTIASHLKKVGYATACVGKWHLGDQAPFLPTRHGFDQYLGVPYSDDMTPRPEQPAWPELPLMQDEQVIEAGIDRNTLTQRYTDEACDFIREHRDEPFFLYLAHAMPGSTSRPFASTPFQGRSANGPYGDSIEEMDASTGRILDLLGELGLDEDTLVITTSDHGPIPNDPPQGSAAPLTGVGYDVSERGMRSPCVVRWPGHIPAGTTRDQITSVMDVLPTLAVLADAPLPEDGPLIDGHDISPLLRGEHHAGSAYDQTGFFYYHREQLQAVRRGPWKLWLPLEQRIVGVFASETQPEEAALYHLIDDPGEQHNRCSEHPDIVAELSALADVARRDLGDLGMQGTGQRPAGWIDDPIACVVSD